MLTEEVGWCCGANAIVDWGYGDPDDYHFPPDENTLNNYKRKLEDILKDQDIGYWVIFLNQYQRKHFHSIIKSFGFKAHRSVMNGNSGNRITMYTLRREDNV